MRDHGVVGSFASGGATGVLADMTAEGLFRTLYDVQSFDDDAARSLAENPNHREMSLAEYADPRRVDCVARRLDVMVISATEVDAAFNVNSLTGTDGRIRGALGGAPDTAAGAALTVVVLPSRRGRIPTVCMAVDTICTPGRDIDIVCTESGIAVNPLRTDLVGALRDAGIAVREMRTLVNDAYRITGVPTAPRRGARVVAVVESPDGTVLDTILAHEPT